jgi:hypothetical protein
MNALKKLFLSLLMLLLISNAFGQKISSDNNIGKILDTYFKVKNALVNNDGTTAKFKAGDFYYLLSSNPDKGLNAAQCKILAANLQPLLDNARAIDQRHYFAMLSKSLSQLLKQLKLNPLTVYEQYCTANNAYWLSETKAIKNPYYNYSDREMTSNGKITATLVRSKKS